MSVGVWEPQKRLNIDAELLRALIALYRAGQGENLAESMDETLVREKAMLMKQEAAAFDAAKSLSDDELADLVRFFTLAETQLPGWEGGKRNPVIYLVKILKERGSFEPELRKWIKANTDNRYLPHGSALAL